MYSAEKNKEYEQNRSRKRHVSLMLTESEFNKLKKKADQCKVTVTKYLIDTAVNGKDPVLFDAEAHRETIELAKLKREMFEEYQRQGNNINQIAKQLNTDAYSGFAHSSLKREFANLRKTWEDLWKWLL